MFSSVSFQSTLFALPFALLAIPGCAANVANIPPMVDISSTATNPNTEVSRAIDAELSTKVDCKLRSDSGLIGNAQKQLGEALATGFSQFPIDHGTFNNHTLGALTPKSICTVLASAYNSTPLNPLDLPSSITAEEALEHGIITALIPMQQKCPESYDWQNSLAYTGVKTCADVTAKIGDNKAPFSMYAIKGANPETIMAYFAMPSTAPLYSPYKRVPISCGLGEENGMRFQDSYRTIEVLPFVWDINFILHTITGPDFEAWMLRPSCKASDGTLLEADDIMFAFGIRYFLRVNVNADGKPTIFTVIIDSAVAASNSSFASWVPTSVAQKRFFASSLKAKVVLESAVKTAH